MKIKTLAIAVLCAAASTGMAAEEYAAELERLASGPVAAIAASPAVLSAVRKQNLETAGLSQEQIDLLDMTWRDATVSGGDIIDQVANNGLSHHLSELKTKANGQYTELIVTDIRGLNVGVSDITSDYWQGDEAKWQVPHDTSGFHIGEVEFDESSQTYQSQVSVPIMDAGVFIGAVTIGIDMQTLVASN